MNKTNYTIRNYRPRDLDSYIQLHLEAEKLAPTVPGFSPQLIRERLNRPGYAPEQDLFIAEISGKLVGFMDTTPELTIGRVVLECWVHPEHRRKGLATRLCTQAMLQAQETGASVAHINIVGDNEIAEEVLSRLGFKYVRTFLELKLDMADFDWPDADQTIIQYRHLQAGEEERLTQIQNASFSGTWGFNPNTVEDIAYRLNTSNHSPDDVLLVSEGGKITGYCWLSITGNQASTIAGRTGRISMIGVDPAYRGQGYGKKVLLAGLIHLRNKGLAVAELTVDSENQVARSLYESVGFKLRTRSLWYEKLVN